MLIYSLDMHCDDMNIQQGPGAHPRATHLPQNFGLSPEKQVCILGIHYINAIQHLPALQAAFCLAATAAGTLSMIAWNAASERTFTTCIQTVRVHRFNA